MSKTSSRARSAIADGLEVHFPAFLAVYAKAGYAEKTRHDKRRAVVQFARWVRAARIAVGDLDEAHVAAFLSQRTPRVGLARPSAVCQVAREALQRAGLRPTGRVGAHIFRHSLATQMIRRGASLGEIAQVLRHRSIQSTQLYTKVELEALRGVAMPWPSAEARP